MKNLKKILGIAGITLASLSPFQSTAQFSGGKKRIGPATEGGMYYIRIGSYYSREDRWNMFLEETNDPKEIKLDSVYTIRYQRTATLADKRYNRLKVDAFIYKGAKVTILDTFGLDYRLEVSSYWAKVRVVENKKMKNEN